MLPASIHSALRLAVAVVLAIAVLLAPGGTSPHHDPAALAEGRGLAAPDMVDHHGHVHEDPAEQAAGGTGSHEHDAADHAHDTTVLPGGETMPPSQIRRPWARLPPLQRWTEGGGRLDRPPRGRAAA